eukprot:scaffold107138_cov38-Cyclotella_meneghiniana.AAC.7
MASYIATPFCFRLQDSNFASSGLIVASDSANVTSILTNVRYASNLKTEWRVKTPLNLFLFRPTED